MSAPDELGADPMRDEAGADSTESAPAPGAGTPPDAGPGTDGEAAPEGAAPAPGTGEGGGGSDGGTPVDDMGAFEEQMGDSELANALERVAAVEEQLARANADLYNLKHEYAGYVRRS